MLSSLQRVARVELLGSFCPVLVQLELVRRKGRRQELEDVDAILPGVDLLDTVQTASRGVSFLSTM